MTSKADRMGLRYLPMAFTKQGVAMLSSVLNSERAIQVHIEIMRAFVHLRRFIATNRNLARRLDRRIPAVCGSRSSDQSVRGMGSGESRYLGIDAPNPVLTHQNGGVGVVYHVPSEVWELPEYLGGDRGMPVRGEEDAEAGGGQHRLNEFPRARRRPGLSENSGMRRHPEEFV